MKNNTLIDFTIIVAVVDVVKHFMRIAAIGIQLGAPIWRIRYCTGIFAKNRTRLFRQDVNSY